MQYLLFFILLILLVINCYIYRNDIIAPAVVMSFTFLVCSFVAVINTLQWNLNLGTTAFWIIILGVLFFSVGTVLAGVLTKQRKKTGSSVVYVASVGVSSFSLVMLLIFQLLIRFLQLKYMKMNVNEIVSFSSMVNMNHYMNESGMLTHTSFIVDFGNIVCNASGYILGYILIANRYAKKKNLKLTYINFIICIVGSMLGGQRTDAFAILLSMVAYYFIFLNRKREWTKLFSIKKVSQFLIIVILTILSFRGIGILLGRGDDINYFDYIFSYLGAQIKNLDIFTKSTRQTNISVWGQETFQQLYGVLDKYLGTSFYQRRYTGGYNFVNGHPLGNVYSAFKSYYSDFGFIGVVIIDLLLGFFSQSVYERCKYRKCKCRGRDVEYSVIMYGYIFFAICFSFFSNKFFEMVFSIRFIYYWIGIFILDFVLFRLQIKGGTVKIKL